MGEWGPLRKCCGLMSKDEMLQRGAKKWENETAALLVLQTHPNRLYSGVSRVLPGVPGSGDRRSWGVSSLVLSSLPYPR